MTVRINILTQTEQAIAAQDYAKLSVLAEQTEAILPKRPSVAALLVVMADHLATNPAYTDQTIGLYIKATDAMHTAMKTDKDYAAQIAAPVTGILANVSKLSDISLRLVANMKAASMSVLQNNKGLAVLHDEQHLQAVTNILDDADLLTRPEASGNKNDNQLLALHAYTNALSFAAAGRQVALNRMTFHNKAPTALSGLINRAQQGVLAHATEVVDKKILQNTYLTVLSCSDHAGRETAFTWLAANADLNTLLKTASCLRKNRHFNLLPACIEAAMARNIEPSARHIEAFTELARHTARLIESSTRAAYIGRTIHLENDTKLDRKVCDTLIKAIDAQPYVGAQIEHYNKIYNDLSRDNNSGRSFSGYLEQEVTKKINALRERTAIFERNRHRETLLVPTDNEIVGFLKKISPTTARSLSMA